MSARDFAMVWIDAPRAKLPAAFFIGSKEQSNKQMTQHEQTIAAAQAAVTNNPHNSELGYGL
ncbi:MAG: hypothetical protein ACOYNY_18500 [Caldilineaceae bacterium]